MKVTHAVLLLSMGLFVSSSFGADATAPKLPEGGTEKAFARIEMDGQPHWLVILLKEKTVLFDRNGDGDLTATNEKFTGEQKDFETPLFPKLETVIVAISGLKKPFGQLNVQWDPGRKIQSVFVTRGPDGDASELAFCQLGDSVAKATLLRFNAKKRVFSIYGTPFTEHRGNPGDGPMLVVRVGYEGEGEKALVSTCHSKLPKEQNPVAEVTFDPEKKDAAVQRVVFEERCCGSQFKSKIVMPKSWKTAKIVCHFPNPPAGWEVERFEKTIKNPKS